VVRIQIKERHFILNIFLLCLAIFLIIGFVSGYGTNTPDTFGHSASEIDVNINGVNYDLESKINDLNNTVGRVVGGGRDGTEGCNAWGSANCVSTSLTCPTGTSKRLSGHYYYYDSASYNTQSQNYYICIT